jgi:hypothetical protein
MSVLIFNAKSVSKVLLAGNLYNRSSCLGMTVLQWDKRMAKPQDGL